MSRCKPPFHDIRNEPWTNTSGLHALTREGVFISAKARAKSLQSSTNRSRRESGRELSESQHSTPAQARDMSAGDSRHDAT